MISALALCTLCALAQAPAPAPAATDAGPAGGPVGAPTPSAATAVTRVTYELPDGGVVALSSLPDAGIVAVVLTPEKALALANERRQKDWELANAKAQAAAPPAPTLNTLLIVVGVVRAVLDAVPIVVSVVTAARPTP